MGGVGGVLEPVATHLVRREDRAVERPDDQRGDSPAAQDAQDPVEQDQGQQDQDQQAGEDDPDERADAGALDDPRARPVGD